MVVAAIVEWLALVVSVGALGVSWWAVVVAKRSGADLAARERVHEAWTALRGSLPGPTSAGARAHSIDVSSLNKLEPEIAGFVTAVGGERSELGRLAVAVLRAATESRGLSRSIYEFRGLAEIHSGRPSAPDPEEVAHRARESVARRAYDAAVESLRRAVAKASRIDPNT